MSTVFVLFCAAFALAVYAGASRLTLEMKSTVVETLPAANVPFADAGKGTITHSLLNNTKTLDANSPAGSNVTQTGQGAVNMTAGAATLNLAACPGTVGVVDMTGLKLRSVHIRAKATNVNNITIAKGAANGYTGLGAAFNVTLAPGKSILLEPDATAVAAGVRTLDITGSGTQGIEILITAGDN